MTIIDDVPFQKIARFGPPTPRSGGVVYNQRIFGASREDDGLEVRPTFLDILDPLHFDGEDLQLPMANINNNPNPEHRNRYWFTTQMILRGVFSVWTGYRARGYQRIAPGGGLLLMNHQSFLDPPLVGLPLKRPISYLARDSLFRVPVLGPFLRRTYVVPINRESAGSSSIREAVARMRQGFLVGIFPEGTRSTDGRLGELKPGFVALVRRAGVPVYPVGIAGSRDALPRNAKWLRPKPIRVVFGAPLTPEELSGNAEQITSCAHQRIAECLNEAECWLRGESTTHEPKQAAPAEQ